MLLLEITPLICVLIAIGCALLGALICYLIFRMTGASLVRKAAEEAEVLKKNKIIEAKEKFIALKLEHENMVREQEKKRQQLDQRLQQREQQLNQRQGEIQRAQNDFNQRMQQKEQQVEQQQKALEFKSQEVEKLQRQAEQQLEKMSGMSAEEAKAQLIESLKDEAKTAAMSYINEIMDDARLNANKEAKRIVIQTIQRVASETAAENTVSVFHIDNDEVKGRIIGREGRNIRTIEMMTGVDLIIDDTPEAITVSCFEPVRREVARLALEKLIADGRIHPTHIEEMVAKARREVDAVIKSEGERAILETGVRGVHPELVKLLGRLHYRTSYGQNVLQHSIEVSHLAGMMAADLGADVQSAKRAGLLHDIGKAIDHEMEGTHVALGVEFLRKYHEKDDVIHAVQAHHNDIEPQTIVACIVQAADAISAARPGARRENLENYIKRLEQLEEITGSYPGVDKAYAIQAGREVRVMVKPEQVNEDQMVILARELARKIEAEMEYPGQIKVHVLRETAAIEYAK